MNVFENTIKDLSTLQEPNEALTHPEKVDQYLSKTSTLDRTPMISFRLNK